MLSNHNSIRNIASSSSLANNTQQQPSAAVVATIDLEDGDNVDDDIDLDGYDIDEICSSSQGVEIVGVIDPNKDEQQKQRKKKQNQNTDHSSTLPVSTTTPSDPCVIDGEVDSSATPTRKRSLPSSSSRQDEEEENTVCKTPPLHLSKKMKENNCNTPTTTEGCSSPIISPRFNSSSSPFINIPIKSDKSDGGNSQQGRQTTATNIPSSSSATATTSGTSSSSIDDLERTFTVMCCSKQSLRSGNRPIINCSANLRQILLNSSDTSNNTNNTNNANDGGEEIMQIYSSSYIFLQTRKNTLFECTPISSQDLHDNLLKNLKKISLPFTPKIIAEGRGVARYYLSTEDEIWASFSVGKFVKVPKKDLPTLPTLSTTTTNSCSSTSSNIPKRIFVGYGHVAFLYENNQIYLKTSVTSEFVLLDHIGKHDRVENMCLGLEHYVIHITTTTTPSATATATTTTTKLVFGGNNSMGQLGGKPNSGDVNIINWNYGSIEKIDCTTNTCILNSSGELWVCGDNSCGQLGLGDFNNRERFEKVPSRIPFIDFSSGKNTTFAITCLHEVVCCGEKKRSVFEVVDTVGNFHVNRVVCKDNNPMVYYSPSSSRFSSSISLLKYPQDYNDQLQCIAFSPILPLISPDFLTILEKFIRESGKNQHQPHQHHHVQNFIDILLYSKSILTLNSLEIVEIIYLASLFGEQFVQLQSCLVNILIDKLSPLTITDTIESLYEKVQLVDNAILHYALKYCFDIVRCYGENHICFGGRLNKFKFFLGGGGDQQISLFRLHVPPPPGENRLSEAPVVVRIALQKLYYNSVDSDINIFFNEEKHMRLHKTVICSKCTLLSDLKSMPHATNFNLIHCIAPEISKLNGIDGNKIDGNSLMEICAILLKFCYSIWDDPPVELLLPLLNLSKIFGFPELSKHIINSIGGYITVESFILMANWFSRENNQQQQQDEFVQLFEKSLVEFATKFSTQILQAYPDDQQWLGVSPKLLVKIMRRMNKHN